MPASSALLATEVVIELLLMTSLSSERNARIGYEVIGGFKVVSPLLDVARELPCQGRLAAWWGDTTLADTMLKMLIETTLTCENVIVQKDIYVYRLSPSSVLTADSTTRD
mmetsp:Transcript_27186/g.43743  ORF Transcript_27186/g.43743 Transcript_27186/m.43743 type:complete len:110 (+) Transcript_27186:429-758(+)